MEPARRSRKDACCQEATRRACLGAAGLALALLGLPLLGGLSYFGLDLTRTDLGVLCELRRRLAAGDGLGISPVLGHGAPLWADPQVQLAYPPRWLALALPVEWGTSLGVLFHLAVAAAAAAWLARTFRVKTAGAAAAGLAFAFCGSVVDLALHATYLAAAAWLPLAWASARRFLERGRAGALTLAWAALALCLLAGEPQSFGVGVALLLLETLRFLVRHRGRGMGRAGALLLTPVLAFATGLVAWWPALAEMALTERRAALASPQALAWSFTPLEWLAALEPGILHRAVVGETALWPLVTGDAEAALPWARDPYVGPLFLVALVLGLRERRARPAALVLGVGLACALGDQTPFFPALLRLLPPLGLFRYPAKYLVVTVLAGAVLAAVAFQRLARPRARRAPWLLGLGVALAFQAILAAFLATHHAELDSWVDPAQAALSVAHQMELPLLSQLLDRSVQVATLPLLAAFLLVALAPGLRRCLPGLVVADLVLAAAGSINVGEGLADVASPLPAVLSRTPHPVLCPDPALVGRGLGIPGVSGPWKQQVLMRVVAFPNLNACEALPVPVHYSVLQGSTNRALEGALVQGHGGAARALGCTAWLSERPLDGHAGTPLPDPRLDPLAQAGIRLWVLEDVLPQAFLAHPPALLASGEDAVRRVLAGSTAADAAAVVDDPLHRLAPGAQLPAGDGAAVAAIDWQVQSLARVTLSGNGGAVVAVKTSFQAGWEATQAGRALPVVRVAGTHVAAVVEDAGAGPVEFRYQSPRHALGTLGGMLGVAGMLLLGTRVRRRGALSWP